jgi:ADP-ribose pyrophosphatase YjhB (NUDIX family)
MSIYRFCFRCGGELVKRETYFWCPQCNFPFFINPRPTVTAIIVQDNKVLLTHRADEPKKGFWDLPGGFINPDERPKEALRRELKEELGAETDLGPLVVIIPERYGIGTKQYGENGVPTLNIYYEVRLFSGDLKPGDDVDQAQWFSVNQLPKLAFRCDQEALSEYLKQHPKDKDEKR